MRMRYETVRVDCEGAVATITLDRPRALNALSLALGRDLPRAVVEIDQDTGVRCIVLTGAGTAFSAGGDISEFGANASRIGAHVRELRRPCTARSRGSRGPRSRSSAP